MKIAFTSCMNITQRPAQPVWQQVAEQNPHILVLLGDSVYIDVPWPSVSGTAKAIEDLSETEFMAHMHGLYRRQLNEVHFATLVKKVPAYAIWDDHDFLGNDSRGAGLPPARLGQLRATRALFRLYAQALEDSDPALFPATTQVSELWKPGETAPGHRHKPLSAQLHLHLLDGRSHRSSDRLLGPSQRAQMEQHLRSHPQALHLVASPIAFEDAWPRESWSKFTEDRQWLQALARQFRMILLSGDIHENRWARHDLGGGRFLCEFTASGAAVDVPLRLPGQATHNFGLLEVDADRLTVKFFSKLGAPSLALPALDLQHLWPP